jgi:hypothetical protein
MKSSFCSVFNISFPLVRAQAGKSVNAPGSVDCASITYNRHRARQPFQIKYLIDFNIITHFVPPTPDYPGVFVVFENSSKKDKKWFK